MGSSQIDASPAELYARSDMGLQWWYYSGHLRSGVRQFAFALTFFRVCTAREELPSLTRSLVSWSLSDHCYAAHFSLLDLETREFHYAYRRDTQRIAGASSDHYRVWSGEWRAEEQSGGHQLIAQMRQGELQLRLVPQKAIVRHGRSGWVDKGQGQCGFHGSFPRMQAEGALTLHDRQCLVDGTAWMDREFGSWRLCPSLQGWDWCCIQLDDGRELMVYVIRDEMERATEDSFMTAVRPCGGVAHFAHDQFTWRAVGTWRSSRTGTLYPSTWRLDVPGLAVALEIQPVCENQELDTRGSTMTVYWEGAAVVAGTIGGESAKGRAYVELFGYNRSHRSVSPWKWIAWELQRRKHGPGRTVCHEGLRGSEMTASQAESDSRRQAIWQQ
jgi:predicted secreted hydrolase